MSSFPILDVQQVHTILVKARLGLVPISQPDDTTILNRLISVADGDLSPCPSWQDVFSTNAIAISYVHTTPAHWYGKVSRGKFYPNTRQRLIQTLVQKQVSALWLDQCLAQRTGDGDAGWAVLGLLPYAAMSVVVVGNYKTLQDIVHEYLMLQRFPEHVLDQVCPTLIDLLNSAWSDSNTGSPDHNDNQKHALCIDFIEMCRFWPMMERALAHKAKGFSYEQETLMGLRKWIEVLKRIEKDLKEKQHHPHDINPRNLNLVLNDMVDMVYSILLQKPGEDQVEGLGHNLLNALAIVTGALGSGALMNARLYQPADREALLLAGMCFNLFTVTQARRQLLGHEIVQIVEDPYRAFGRISERIPATFHTSCQSLVAANALYNRSAVDAFDIPHSTIADEVTIYSNQSARLPTSRAWNGQWELIPHLSLTMRGSLIDIGERSMNSDPYDDFIMRQCFSTNDITGKPVRAMLCNGPLNRNCTSVRMIAISLFSATWTLRNVERKIFEKHGLKGWTSIPVFLGVCDLKRRLVSVEAIVIGHATVLEEDHLKDGKFTQPKAMQFIKAILRRSSSPLHKSAWINDWIARHFDATNHHWYCIDLAVPLHHFTWRKWCDVTPRSIPTINEPHPAISTKFAILSCVTVKTKATMPQLPLVDVLRFVQAAMILSSGSLDNASSSTQSPINFFHRYFNRTFETWLGMLTGLYHAYYLHNPPTSTPPALSLFLPSCKLFPPNIILSSPDLLDEGSGFLQGLSKVLPSLSQPGADIDPNVLNWDLSSSADFWTAKQAILHTLHMYGAFCTMLLASLVQAAYPRTEANASSLSTPQRYPSGEQVLVYQLERSVDALCARLSTNQTVIEVLNPLIEHLVTNARLSMQQSDWRLMNELSVKIMECISQSESAESSALEMQAAEVVRYIGAVREKMKQVRDANIVKEKDEDYSESVRRAFEKMLGRSADGDAEDHEQRGMGEVVGIEELDQVVHKPAAGSANVEDKPELDETETEAKELVMILEWLEAC